MESNRVYDILRQFAERSTEREHDLLRFSSRHEVDLDEEAAAGKPIFHSSYNLCGFEAIAKMINFTSNEFRQVH